MKIVFVIILCLQLLQKGEAAPFDDDNEMRVEDEQKVPPDEPLLYDHVELGEETESITEELGDTIDFPPEGTKSEWKELSEEFGAGKGNAAAAAENKINDDEEDMLGEELPLDIALEQSLPTRNEINRDNNAMNKDDAGINRANNKNQWKDNSPLKDEENQWTDAQEVKVKITEIHNTKTRKPLKVLTQVSEAKCTNHIPEVNTKQYSSDVMVGGSGGETRNLNINGENHKKIVQSLKFWKSSNSKLLGICLEAKLSDGSKVSCGAEKGTASETFYIRPNERIRYLTIYTGKSDCSGYVTGVYFSTNQGRYFSFREKSTRYYYQPHIGSGILVGFKAGCGSIADSLMFLFLQEVESSTLSNVHYPNINSLSVIERPVHINGMRCNNKGRKTEQDFTFSGTRSVHETHQWSFGTTDFEAKLTNIRIKSSIFSITKSIATTSLKSNLITSNPYTHGIGLDFNTTQHYTFNIKVPAGKQVIATAAVYQGIIETPYTGTLTVKLITGKTYTYTVTGVYRSRSTSNVVVATKDVT